MKHFKTILALLLCLCMLPLSAFAYTVDQAGGTHTATVYTPSESGLYAVTVTKGGETLSPLPAKAAVYEPAMTVSVKSGGVDAQAVDYNVFWLEKGKSYTVQLQNVSDGTYDDSGEWNVSVAPVKPQALTLNADTLLEGEWFTFTPETDGSFTFAAAPAPVFVEVMTVGAVSGDWATYALDKEKCRVGMELDYLRSLKAAIDLRTEEITLAEHTYEKALDKLDNYNSMIDLADKTGIGSEGSNLFGKKQAVYDALKAALRRGDSSFSFNIPFIGDLFPALDLPTIDPEIIDEMPANVTDLPDWLSARLQSSEGAVGEAKQKVDDLRAEQAADQARYDAGIAANPQLAGLVDNTSVETASLRQQVKTDADAIMAGASALAAGDGLQLVAAQWLNTGDSGMAVDLKAGTTYIIHALTNLDASVSVTDGTVTPVDPPVQTVDKKALDKAISDAKKVDADKYTEESVAAMNETLAEAETVQANPDATQAEVDAAAKKLNDAVQALVPKEETQEVDKTALQAAIDRANALKSEDYTDASFAAVTLALATATLVNLNPLASQDRVDEVTAALNDAIDALVEKPAETVDKTALQQAISDAEKVDTTKYTEDSVAAMNSALDSAKGVNNDPDATQEAVDNAATALNNAIQALKEKEVTPTVDKTALQQAISDAEKVDTTKYTEDSVAAMNSALDSAKGVNNDPDATQEAVDNAATALNNAIQALKEKEVTPTVDKTALQEAINRAEAIDTSKYTDESVAALQQALTAAKAVLGADSVPQAGVDNATKALNDAIAGLKEKDVTPPVSGVDKTALQQAVDAAKAIDRTKYTDDSLAALDTQVQNAEALLANDSATQAQVNLATRRVNNAISALKEKTAPQPVKFVDVPETAYYADAVDWAVENGITNGKDATHFAPKDDCTRAQIVTFLWRTAGEPEPATTVNPFVDVNPSAYYYKAVLWAVGEGITNGTDATHFSPNATCTRAHAVTFLWRMEGEPMPTNSRSSFADVQDMNAYYYYAVMWAVENGITNGTDPTHFSPKQTCSRAQIVTFLYRDKVGA